MTSPVLALLPDARAELTSAFDAAFASLNNHFTVVDAREDADIAVASAVVDALDGLVNSSDIDCGYYPCTLTAPELGSDEFFAAAGIGRDERQSVGGFDNAKLSVINAGDGEDERPAVLLITWLSNNITDPADAAEYIGEACVPDVERAVELLGRAGKIQGVQLCTDDRVTKIQLVVARQPSGVYAGVLTVSIET